MKEKPKSAGRLAAAGAAALAVWLGLTAAGCSGGRSPAEKYTWVTMDESYAPRNSVEEFIKADAEDKGLLPVSIRDYGRSATVLKKFRGRNLAAANETVLGMTFKGLEDWMLVDLRYRNENERDVQRTILYVQVNGRWMVGDSGRLMD